MTELQPVNVPEIQEELPNELVLVELSDIFKMLGDPTRLRLIFALQGRELCVSDLSEIVQMSPSAVSHQLKTLRTQKLIKSRRDGKNMFYSLDDDHVDSIIATALIHVDELNF